MFREANRLFELKVFEVAMIGEGIDEPVHQFCCRFEIGCDSVYFDKLGDYISEVDLSSIILSKSGRGTESNILNEV